METPTQATNEEEIYQELKEIIHYFGGMDEGYKKIREMIDMIEENEKEERSERYFSRY